MHNLEIYSNCTNFENGKIRMNVIEISNHINYFRPFVQDIGFRQMERSKTKRDCRLLVEFIICL